MRRGNKNGQYKRKSPLRILKQDGTIVSGGKDLDWENIIAVAVNDNTFDRIITGLKQDGTFVAEGRSSSSELCRVDKFEKIILE